MGGFPLQACDDPVEPLTRREREILCLLAGDQTNQQIADQLRLSLSSIKWFTWQIYQKLGVNNRRQALSKARKIGLLDRDSPQSPPFHNLPNLLTSFIGREKEIAALNSLFSSGCRFVNLTGSGGVGKTRLALQAAGSWVDIFTDGVWLVELASLASPSLIPQAMAEALHLILSPGQDLAHSLFNILRSKKSLLILDNCEHLLDGCANLVRQLLITCPGVAILATSREVLGVEGETVFSVSPLLTPDSQHLPALDKLTRFDAVHLFVERARSARPGFGLSPSNAPALAQIVNRLEGIPLAIELIAARMRYLSVEEIAQRLDHNFLLLSQNSRLSVHRHQTLWASTDWSYQLLQEPERILLRRLAIFTGTWDLTAAEEICASHRATIKGTRSALLPKQDILSLLSHLVDKSLIVIIGQVDGCNRFHMLETIRQYAYEKLLEQGESEEVRARHLAYFGALAEALAPGLYGRQQVRVLDRLEHELDNLRLALDWAIQSDIEAELRLATALWRFWHIRCRWTEGIGWLERGLARVQALRLVWDQEQLPYFTERLDHLRIKALAALGAHYVMLYNNSKAKIVLDECLAYYRRMMPEYPLELAFVLKWYAWTKFTEGQVEQAMASLSESLKIFTKFDDWHGMVESLHEIGLFEGDLSKKKEAHLRQLILVEAANDEDGIATAQLSLGMAALAEGEYKRAGTYFMNSHSYYVKVGNSLMSAWTLALYGYAALFQGEFQAGLHRVDEALFHFEEIGAQHAWFANSLFIKGELAFAQESPVQVLEDIGFWNDYGVRSSNDLLLSGLHCWRARQARLGSSNFEAASHARVSLEMGRTTGYQGAILFANNELGLLAIQSNDLGQAHMLLRESFRIGFQVNYSNFLPYPFASLAVLASRQARFERAARLFGALQRRCPGIQQALPPADRALFLEAKNAARSVLGEAVYGQHFQDGLAMPLTRAQAYALAEE